MTASLYRRLTDLGTDAEAATIAREMNLPSPEALLTTSDAIAAGADPHELAKALLALGEARDRKTLVALLSVPQAQALEQGTVHAARVERILVQAAQATPLRARLMDLRGKRIAPGDGEVEEIGAVVRLVDGAPLAERTTRGSGRVREARRYTLSADAIAAIDAAAKRDGMSASAVVERAVLKWRSS